MAKYLIETITLDSSAASITFNNIPQTYTDLQIVLSVRSDESSGSDLLEIDFNSNASNQSSLALRGDGSSVISFTTSTLRIANINNSGQTSNTFSSISTYITNYAAASAKSVSSDFAMENNDTFSYQGVGASLWDNTSAITSITLSAAFDFIAGSTASLYGFLAGNDGSTTVS